jgi:hypothetical protein
MMSIPFDDFAVFITWRDAQIKFRDVEEQKAARRAEREKENALASGT